MSGGNDYRRLLCLNPYYTGIHLHSETGRGLGCGESLNPYYTGIHLHLSGTPVSRRMPVS